MLKLDNIKNEITRNLSRGEKQRVAILRGILTNPKTLILDEPTSSLDKTNSQIVMNFLNEIAKDILVLFTTHDLNIIHEYNIDIIEIEYGSIISNTITKKQVDSQEVLKTNTLKKNSFKNINYIRKKIFHKQNFKSIFSMVLLSISLILLVIPFVVFTYNKYDFSYNIYKKTDYDTFIMKNSLGHLVNEQNFDYSKYNKLTKHDYYYNLLKWYSNYSYIGCNAIVDDTIDDDKLIITDYTYDKLTDKSKIKDGSIIFGDYKFLLSIKETNYNWYKKQDSETKSKYIDFVDYYYNNFYLNSNTLTKISNVINGYKKITINNFSYNLYKISDKINDSNTMFSYGTSNLEDNEIILGDRYYFDNKIDEKVGNTVKIFDKEYIIKDIEKAGSVLDVIVSDNEYANFKGEINFEMYSKYISLECNNEKDFKQLMKDMEKEEYEFAIPYFDDLDFCLSQLEEIKTLTKYVVPIAIILFFLSAFATSYMLVINNKRRFAISISLGMSRRSFVSVIAIEVSKIVGVALVFSICAYLYFYFKYNTFFKKETSFNFFVNNFELLGLCIYFLILAVIIGLMTFYMIHKFNKNTLKNNIDE